MDFSLLLTLINTALTLILGIIVAILNKKDSEKKMAIDAHRAETEEQSAKTDAMEASIAAMKEAMATLVAENNRLKETIRALREDMALLEAQIMELGHEPRTNKKGKEAR